MLIEHIRFGLHDAEIRRHHEQMYRYQINYKWPITNETPELYRIITNSMR